MGNEELSNSRYVRRRREEEAEPINSDPMKGHEPQFGVQVGDVNGADEEP